MRTRRAAACCCSPGISGSGRSTRSSTRSTIKPMAVLARPLDNPLLHDLLESVRTATGNTVIYRRGAIRRVLRALEANQAVAILIDQHMQTADAVYVDFFNRPAATTLGAGGAGAAHRRAGRPGVRAAAAGRAVPHGLRARRRAAARRRSERRSAKFTQRCTDVLEMYVRRYPDLWLWMHRRWRDVPAPQR